MLAPGVPPQTNLRDGSSGSAAAGDSGGGARRGVRDESPEISVRAPRARWNQLLSSVVSCGCSWPPLGSSCKKSTYIGGLEVRAERRRAPRGSGTSCDALSASCGTWFSWAASAAGATSWGAGSAGASSGSGASCSGGRSPSPGSTSADCSPGRSSSTSISRDELPAAAAGASRDGVPCSGARGERRSDSRPWTPSERS